MLLRVGFTIAHVEEWGPTGRADRFARPVLAVERERPRSCSWRRAAVPARPRRLLFFERGHDLPGKALQLLEDHRLGRSDRLT